MRLYLFIALCLPLAACNSIYLKPGTLDTSKPIYATHGGYSMQRSIKQVMEERGYKIRVGNLRTEKTISDGEIQTFDIPNNVKYVVIVKERKEFLRPIWCAFNGFWWWNFNASITNKETGEEILSWRGRGCQNSSIKKLNDILDELEKKETTSTANISSSTIIIKKPKKELIIMTNN